MMPNFYWLLHLLLHLHGLRHLGGWEGAPEGCIKMAGVEAGEASSVG